MKNVKGLPVIGPNTGATSLHKSGANNVFWVRTNYDFEVERLVRFADTLGLKRIALAYPDDPFGQAVLVSFRGALANHGLMPVGIASTPNTASLEVEPAARQLAGMQAQVLIMSLAGTMPALHKAYRAAGGAAVCLGLSVSGSASNILQLAQSQSKPIFSVIVPAPNAQRFALVRRYQRDMLASGFDSMSLLSLEGYVDAAVLVEGLRNAGPKVDRESLIAGLESLSDFDLGGVRMRFGKGRREGNTYTDIVTVDANGKLKS
ncbi:ABC transporter substrate-binding protein [Diaphorobacter sp. HDW4A]|uniref:ABC transporter substrate-binding protein n=1 Tax=Diaphorobacter sp. HDW4A TaxID=2714924 RepID=UPI00140CE90E|nr:ABC transporter substrate-binding protein [Diaphorobacter sp. HDW4A]